MCGGSEGYDNKLDVMWCLSRYKIKWDISIFKLIYLEIIIVRD